MWKTCIEETLAQHNQHTSLHISFRQCDASLWLLQWLVIMVIYLWYGAVSLCFQDQLQLRNVARQCMATPAPDIFFIEGLEAGLSPALFGMTCAVSWREVCLWAWQLLAFSSASPAGDFASRPRSRKFMIEGSLEVKLPTIWTDGKAEVGKVREEKRRREKIRRKKMQVRERLEKSRNTVFFQCLLALEGRKVGSPKRRVRSHVARWEMKNCTPLWREAHFQVKMLKAP